MRKEPKSDKEENEDKEENIKKGKIDTKNNKKIKMKRDDNKKQY